ncbi:MAG: ankyrin repeat domain-containing protein [Flavobacteriaceae bacterium]
MDMESFFNAIRQGDLNTVKTLGNRHPDLLDGKDQRGSTPLILATYYNHGDIVDFLLEKGVGVDEKDGVGNTALMGVCFKGYTDIAEKLMKAGADVNTTNTMGSSCLIFAVTFNQEGITHMLLAHGADKSLKDARGHSALDHARMQGFSKLIELLENGNINQQKNSTGHG